VSRIHLCRDDEPSHFETRLAELLGGRTTTRERYRRIAREAYRERKAELARSKPPFLPLFAPPVTAL
jgi:hypothetical protein